MAMRVLLSLGPQQIVVGIISVYLESLDWSLQRELLEILGTPPRLSAQSMCSAADFKAYVPLNDITRVPTEKIILKAEVDRSLWGLLDHLRMHISGAVFLSKSFLMLMHPTGMEAWSFLETSPQSGSGAKLNCHFFRLHSSLPGTIGDGALEQPPRRSGQHSLPFLPYPVHLLNVLNHLYGIEMKSLLPKSSKGSRQTDTFFLIFPSAVSEERNLYIDFLTKSGAKMILSDHEQGTSWDFYRQHYEHGVVLIHPTFTDIHRIPKLAQLMRKNFNVFEFGIDTTGFKFARLFPHGGAVLITDAFILKAPMAAEMFINWFALMVQQKAPNTWKLVTRPGFKDWILSVAQRKGDEEGALSETHIAYYKIWLLLDNLLPEHLMIRNNDSDDDGNNSNSADYPADDALVMWEDLPGYGNGTRDPGPHLAEWFCGWALLKIKQYRRFVIVDPVAGDHLRFSDAVDVVTPEQYMETYA